MYIVRTLLAPSLCPCVEGRRKLDLVECPNSTLHNKRHMLHSSSLHSYTVFMSWKMDEQG